MIEGVFDICVRCGGEVSVTRHLIDAHAGHDDGFPVHLVWSHPQCGVTTETGITDEQYHSARSVLALERGDKVEREYTQEESELAAWVAILSNDNRIEEVLLEWAMWLN